MDTISYNEFSKLDIRIGKVISAEKVPETDRLLKLVVDIGDEKRQIVSGIADSFPDPSVLIDKEVPILINLEPRKIKGLESQGMLLAVSAGEKAVLLAPEESVPAGSSLK